MRFVPVILFALTVTPWCVAAPPPGGPTAELRQELNDVQQLLDRVQRQIDQLHARAAEVRAAVEQAEHHPTPAWPIDRLQRDQQRILHRLDRIANRLDELEPRPRDLVSPRWGRTTVALPEPDAIEPPAAPRPAFGYQGPAPAYNLGYPAVSAGSGEVHHVTRWPGRTSLRYRWHPLHRRDWRVRPGWSRYHRYPRSHGWGVYVGNHVGGWIHW